MALIKDFIYQESFKGQPLVSSSPLLPLLQLPCYQ
jgi:hypothetical protein